MTNPAAYAAIYLAAGFATLAWAAWHDDTDARTAFWLSLLWPLTMVVVAWLLLGRLLRWMGFRFFFGRPRDGLGWSAGRMSLRDPDFPRVAIGFWVACPWRAGGLGWVAPWARRP